MKTTKHSLSRITLSTTLLSLALALFATGAQAERKFAGIVSSATPEATAAGVEILEKGGNEIDAAVAASLALGATESAGSGLFGRTVMLVRTGPDKEPFVINGTTYSPGNIPDDVSDGIPYQIGDVLSDPRTVHRTVNTIITLVAFTHSRTKTKSGPVPQTPVATVWLESRMWIRTIRDNSHRPPDLAGA